MTVVEIREEALKQFKEKKFDRAVSLYKELWENYREKCSEWEGWRYAFSLKQTKNYTEALNVCREVYEAYPNFEPIREVYAWCIYFTEIALEQVNDSEIFFNAGKTIIKLVKQKNKSVVNGKDFPCVYTLTIFKILEYLKRKPNSKPEEILEWAQKLNPDLLGTNPFVFIDKNKKRRELASHKEQWFLICSKALYE